VPFTIVSFHAHPDDEALLTAGTLARAAAQGHRVVLVTATDGGAGLAADRYGRGATLAEHRLAELRASAAAIGAARVEWLGYADSGLDGEAPDPPGSLTFVHAPAEQAAQRLAAILAEESADVLTGYDPRGGYGHPDHVRVHQVARLAAAQHGTVVLLEATVHRELIARALHLAGRLRLLPAELAPSAFDEAYSPRADLTHRVDVRRFTAAKRAAMRAHSSQASGGSGDRTLAAFLRLPTPLYRWVLGREWFTEVGRPPAKELLDDPFASLR
jgi:LmbE family N-acetylglucosaminyl deacetylase